VAKAKADGTAVTVTVLISSAAKSVVKGGASCGEGWLVAEPDLTVTVVTIDLTD